MHVVGNMAWQETTPDSGSVIDAKKVSSTTEVVMLLIIVVAAKVPLTSSRDSTHPITAAALNLDKSKKKEAVRQGLHRNGMIKIDVLIGSAYILTLQIVSDFLLLI